MAGITRRAVQAVIRPPRKEYSLKDLPLELQAETGQKFLRYPVTFRNNRKQDIVGSIYHSIEICPFQGGPCVMYLHGNASSQLEGQFLVPNFCPYGVFVFCFDFAGCGCSSGEYVSLGWFERDDTEFLIATLNKMFNMGPFLLWGRSMGAATTLLVKHPLVIGRVSDSAFTSVPDLCSAIATQMHLPSIFVSMALWYLKKKVLQAAHFRLECVAPIAVDNMASEVPAVFGHAEKDQFIPFEQCNRLYKHYQTSQKYLMVLPGGHNSTRKIEWIQLGVCFCLEQLKIPVDHVKISLERTLQESTSHFRSFDELVDRSDALRNDEDLSHEEEEVYESCYNPADLQSMGQLPDSSHESLSLLLSPPPDSLGNADELLSFSLSVSPALPDGNPLASSSPKTLSTSSTATRSMDALPSLSPPDGNAILSSSPPDEHPSPAQSPPGGNPLLSLSNEHLGRSETPERRRRKHHKHGARPRPRSLPPSTIESLVGPELNAED